MPNPGLPVALLQEAVDAVAQHGSQAEAARAGEVMTGIAETTMLWGIGLSVLGIYVAGRSKEKGSSLLGALPFPVPGRKPR
jgi:hypothetical protein